MFLNIDLLFPWSAENNLNNENLTKAVNTKRQKNTPADRNKIVITNLECHHIIVLVA